MFGLKDLKLKSKLVAMQLATAGLVLLFYAAFSFFSNLSAAKESLLRQQTAVADLLAGNTASALDFMDQAAAAKVLSSLAAEPDIVNAVLYAKDGATFARYSQREYIDFAPPRPEREVQEFSGGFLTLSRRVVRDNEVIGMILLRSEMRAYRRIIARSAALGAAALLLGLLGAFALALVTQRNISEPVRVLVDAARMITRTGKYAVRVQKPSDDEIGELGDAFNEMISEVENREAALREARDTLEEKVAARTAELGALNAQLGAIFEAASSGIMLVRDRVILRCNHKLYDIFRHQRGTMIGQTTRFGYVDDKDYAEVGEGVAAAAAAGTQYFRELQLQRADGTRFWGRIRAQAAEHEGKPVGVVAMVDDITAEREAAEALRQAKDAAESADRLKSAFLATMSHELRTPLNSIIGFSGILLQGLAGPLNDEQKKQLGMVSGSAEHLLALINDVLDISKIEAGQLQVTGEQFDLREAVHHAVLTAKPLADKKSIEIYEETAPEVGSVYADRRRVEQVLLNLLSNAVKFTEKGGVRVETAVQGGQAVIRVSDSGIGMKPEDMGDLFKPFRQIDTGLSRQYEGTGLGLSICKRLAELMGGGISVESEWGKGSVFTVVLPVKKGAA